MGTLYGRNANRALSNMTNRDNDVVMTVTERFERRHAEEKRQIVRWPPPAGSSTW